MIKRYEDKKNVSGEFIKNAREEKKMSKTKLSIRLELQGIYLDGNEIYRIEENKLLVKDFELIGIAKALDIDLNKLKDLLDWLFI